MTYGRLPFGKRQYVLTLGEELTAKEQWEGGVGVMDMFRLLLCCGYTAFGAFVKNHGSVHLIPPQNVEGAQDRGGCDK